MFEQLKTKLQRGEIWKDLCNKSNSGLSLSAQEKPQGGLRHYLKTFDPKTGTEMMYRLLAHPKEEVRFGLWFFLGRHFPNLGVDEACEKAVRVWLHTKDRILKEEILTFSDALKIYENEIKTFETKL